MKLIEKLREKLLNEIMTNEEIDVIMEENKYFPDERDETWEEGVLKYTNTKSQIWVKYIRENNSYLIADVTMKTKKKGKTKTRAFRTTDEIKGMMDYFRDNRLYDCFMIFVLGIFLARRIGDILSLKWSDFYEENGKRKETLNTLIEDKTEKIIEISLTNITWKYINWYCNQTGITPMKHFHEDIFMTPLKGKILEVGDQDAYKEAIEKQESSFRYYFQKAAAYNNIDGVSCHSMRKTFGYIVHEINKFDPDCLPGLQTIFGHSNIETTKIYIDVMAEKGEKYYNDVGRFIDDIDNGIKPVIDNVPVIAIKTNDLRDILITAYKMGKDNSIESIDAMNQLLTLVEDKRISA